LYSNSADGILQTVQNNEEIISQIQFITIRGSFTSSWSLWRKIL